MLSTPKGTVVEREVDSEESEAMKSLKNWRKSKLEREKKQKKFEEEGHVYRCAYKMAHLGSYCDCGKISYDREDCKKSPHDDKIDYKRWNQLVDQGHSSPCAGVMVRYGRKCSCGHDYIYRPNKTPKEVAEIRAREAEDRLNKEYQADIYGVEGEFSLRRHVRQVNIFNSRWD